MNKEIEVWKDIPNYEGLYQVSSWGRVKSLNYNHTGKERILKPQKNTFEYLHISLCKDSKRKTFTVHRLVATAFIPNPYNLPQINHKDENKENNHVDNLEFCTAKHNSNYGTRNERLSKKMSEAKSKPIYQYTKVGEFIREWQSATHAEKELNIPQGNICQCCKGKYKSAGGYTWQYKE